MFVFFSRIVLIEIHFFRPYSCAKCSTTFRTQLQLRKHAKSQHPTHKRQRTGRKYPAIVLSEEQTTALATQNAEMAGTVSEQVLIASAIETVEMSKIANAEVSAIMCFVL